MRLIQHLTFSRLMHDLFRCRPSRRLAASLAATGRLTAHSSAATLPRAVIRRLLGLLVGRVPLMSTGLQVVAVRVYVTPEMAQYGRLLHLLVRICKLARQERKSRCQAVYPFLHWKRLEPTTAQLDKIR